MNDEARSQASEAYEMVTHSEAASPVSNVAMAEARADDVFRHFFENVGQEETETGFFLGEMLSTCVEDDAERKRLFPSKANRRLLLTTIYSNEAMNRIQADALVLFLVLQQQGSLADARRFSRATRLPSHVLHRIRAFHHLDQGRYLQGVSLLPQSDLLDPSQTAKVLRLLMSDSQLDNNHEEAEGRALALDQLLSITDPETISQALEEMPDTDESMFAQARIVSLCHAHGIVEAWNAVLRDDDALAIDKDKGATTISACILALVRFCLVPSPKPRAVDALVSMPLSQQEDDEVAEVLLAGNAPAQVATVKKLPDTARDTALELVVVRRIASGRYMDAIRLLGRIDREAATRTTSYESTDEGLSQRRRQQLRQKRQGLLAACKASLTHVERSLLAVEGVVAMEEVEDSASSATAMQQEGGNEPGMTMSWEKVDNLASSSSFSEHEASQPLTASPAVRASPLRQSRNGGAGNDSQSALLAAVVRASSSSPRSTSLSQSQSQSPSLASPQQQQQLLRKSSNIALASPSSAAASPLRAKSRLAFLRQSSSSSSPSSSSPHSNTPVKSPMPAVASPLLLRAGQRPYALYDKGAAVPDTPTATAPTHEEHGEQDMDEEAAAPTMDSPLAGPYARLATQLQAQGTPQSPSELLKPMLSTRGPSGGAVASRAVAAAKARGRSASMDVDDDDEAAADETLTRGGGHGEADEAPRGSPLMQKPVRRYEPTYKMSGKGRQQRRAQGQDVSGEEGARKGQAVQAEEGGEGAGEEQQTQKSPAKGKRTRRTRATAATPARRATMEEKKTKEEEHKIKVEGEEEEEEDQVMDLEEPRRRGKAATTKKKTTAAAAAATPKKATREANPVPSSLPRRSSRLSSVEPTISASNTVPEMRDLGMPASLTSTTTRNRASGATSANTGTGTRNRTRTRSASPTKKDAQQTNASEGEEEDEDEVPRRRRTTRTTRTSKMTMPGAF